MPITPLLYGWWAESGYSIEELNGKRNYNRRWEETGDVSQSWAEESYLLFEVVTLSIAQVLAVTYKW